MKKAEKTKRVQMLPTILVEAKKRFREQPNFMISRFKITLIKVINNENVKINA